MKKKALIFASLCILGFFTWHTQAANIELTYLTITNRWEHNIPHGYDEIVLQGTLTFAVSPNAIEAGANCNSVYLHFNQNFGDVSIKIYNSSGSLCYNGVVNTSVQQTVIVSIAGAASGDYVLELNNTSDYAEGEFNK